jgi:hypothetical protein
VRRCEAGLITVLCNCTFETYRRWVMRNATTAQLRLHISDEQVSLWLGGRSLCLSWWGASG